MLVEQQMGSIKFPGDMNVSLKVEQHVHVDDDARFRWLVEASDGKISSVWKMDLWRCEPEPEACWRHLAATFASEPRGALSEGEFALVCELVNGLLRARLTEM